jgi:hypothetical protein
MNNAVFWDVMPCGSCDKRRFGVKHRLHHQDEENQRARNNVSRNQQLTSAAGRNTLEDGIFHFSLLYLELISVIG